MKKSLALATVAASLLAGAAQAQDLPKTHLKVVGGLSNLTAYNDYESRSGPRPFRKRPRARSPRTSRASTKWA